ncbi:hypothetical protein TNCV_2048551, partial [Trichonephila clavipes]
MVLWGVIQAVLFWCLVLEKISKMVRGVADYNDKMGGVDKVDQHLDPYSTPRKERKIL